MNKPTKPLECLHFFPFLLHVCFTHPMTPFPSDMAVMFQVGFDDGVAAIKKEKLTPGCNMSTMMPPSPVV